jgi:L-rhamnose mutarotase
MYNMKSVASLLLVCLFFSCQEQQGPYNSTTAISVVKPLRYGMVTGLKPEKIEHYKKMHASPWPAVKERISDCNIHNYSIYLQKIEDQYYLFSYFEYTGQNFDADMEKMAADTVTQRWWRETDPCQLPLKEALVKHQIWTSMEEVFHQD